MSYESAGAWRCVCLGDQYLGSRVGVWEGVGPVLSPPQHGHPMLKAVTEECCEKDAQGQLCLWAFQPNT